MVAMVSLSSLIMLKLLDSAVTDFRNVEDHSRDVGTLQYLH